MTEHAATWGERLAMHRPPVATCLLALLCAGVLACRESPEIAAWTIGVREGTPVKEYAAVPSGERDPGTVRLTEELVIGVDPEDPDASVYRPSFVAATEAGTIFIADSATTRVQMFDRGGLHIGTLGREGQGPGEFASLSGMTIAGDLLVVQDRSNNRFSTWTLDGEHVADRAKMSSGRHLQMRGLTERSFIAISTEQSLKGGSTIIARHDTNGALLSLIDEVELPPALVPDPSWTRADVSRAFISLLKLPTRAFAVGDGATVYVSPTDEYQVLALSPKGAPAWALRVAWQRPPLLATHKAAIVAQASRMDAGITDADFDWPPHDRAIAALLTDGAGRLYVVLNVAFEGEPPPRMPVDVYSPAGDRIAAGFIPARWSELSGSFLPPWTYAVGEYVFGLSDEPSGETAAVRYRLLLDTGGHP